MHYFINTEILLCENGGVLNEKEFFPCFSDAVKFWGEAAGRRSLREILDTLAVTGGVPRYLEEMNPALPVDENVRRTCFLPDGCLFADFENIFDRVFGR